MDLNPRIATTSNRFLTTILKMGGLATAEAPDIHGEGRKLKRYGGARVFRKNGQTIDDIASGLYHQGWLTRDEYEDTDGGAQRVRDMVLDALQGELAPVFPDDIQREFAAEQAKRAQMEAEQQQQRPARKPTPRPRRQQHMSAHTLPIPDPEEFYEAIGATRHRPAKKKARKAAKRATAKAAKPLSARLKSAKIEREYYPNPRETMNRRQLEALRAAWNQINNVNPESPHYARLLALLDRASPALLKQMAGAKIRFVSALALNRINRQKINPRQRALGLRARKRPASGKRIALQFHAHNLWATVKTYPDTPAGERAAITAGKRLHKTLPHKLRVERIAL